MNPSLSLRDGRSIRDQWSAQHANLAVKETWNKILDKYQNEIPADRRPSKIEDGVQLPEAPAPVPLPVKHRPEGEPLKFNVGVIGAGAAGLFVGMILDWLKEQSQGSIEFEYHIHEASDRVGGRMYTHTFSKGPHDYYDVGAMRFPENSIMRRVFLLFKWLDMEKKPLRTAGTGDLVPYYLESDPEPWCFNDRTEWGSYESISAQSADPWGINPDGSIPPALLKRSPDEIFNALTEPLRNQLRQDLEGNKPSRKGWDMLMKYDDYTTRSFLQQCAPTPPFPPPQHRYETIQWLETFIGGTNWYDQAFSEAVLESLDFRSSEWWCVLGGTGELASRMRKSLGRQSCLHLKSGVTRIEAKFPSGINISVNNNDRSPLGYDAVFSSVPFGCLRQIDTRGANLKYPVKQAMRTLSYGPTAKVGIKFRRAWWIHDLFENNLKKAGQGHSDLGIRTCVYPSYNIEDPAENPAVLLCSYTWQQDALRLGPLISRNPDPVKKVQEEEPLKKLLFRDLARMHASEKVPESEVYELIVKNYETHYAFSWDQNPHSVGGFGFFGPQQFRSAWANVIQPQGDLYMVGEAASPHHAWVVGAIESAVHAVHSWLVKLAGTHPELQDLVYKMEQYETECPFQGLPPYMEKNTSKWHAVLSTVHSQEAGGSKDSKAVADVLTAIATNSNIATR